MEKSYIKFHKNSIVKTNKKLQLIKKDIEHIKKRNIEHFGEIKQNAIVVTCPKCRIIIILYKPFEKLECSYCNFSHNFSKKP